MQNMRYSMWISVTELERLFRLELGITLIIQMMVFRYTRLPIHCRNYCSVPIVNMQRSKREIRHSAVICEAKPDMATGHADIAIIRNVHAQLTPVRLLLS